MNGDHANRFFIVFEGCVKLHRETPDGEESVISLLLEGDMFGEAAIFSDARFPFSAHVAENAKLFELSSENLKEKVKSNPKIMALIMKAMSKKINQLRLENEHMALMSTPQRVGCLLLELSENMQGKGGTFTFPYDKSLAAAQLGMKPETFSRALLQLKPIGVITKGAEITIDSFACLVEYSCGHCCA
jgi:CRP-like cAMP-binding protein